MAQISLHDYLQQIDTLLEENRLSEAIAHCRHILKKFPRHVETYRLFGKAFLEQQKFDDAADIFKRVLSADPEDFVSHVGLAITHKEKGEVPKAIWHFERAFEMDPYNGAIQDELRGLYANRDGLRPERINLTRGALARLYFRGHLYRQAAAELRQILTQNGERIDLQTLLAETLWRDDQRVDVVDICLRILDKTPYCIKANAILAEVWLVTGRSDEAHEYLQRLRMLTRPEKAHLDPDSVVGRAFRSNGVIDLPEQVLIEELDYIPVAHELSGESDWVTELGIDSGEVDEEASWLDEIEKIDAGVFAAAADSDEDMLDWLREVAVSEGESIDEDETQPGGETNILDFEDEGPESIFDDAEDDTFDWFSQEAETSRESLADVPDWLSEVTASAEADMWNMAIEANESQPEADEDDSGSRETIVGKAETPDWIRDVAQENAHPDPTLSWREEDSVETWHSEEESPTEFTGDGEIPDWMRGRSEDDDEFPEWLNESDEVTRSGEEALPDWLTNPEEDIRSEMDFPEFSIEDSVYGVTGEEIPDWLLGSDEETASEDEVDIEPILDDSIEAETGANLTGANLAGATIAEEDIAGSDFGQADFDSVFDDVDFDADFEASLNKDSEDPFGAAVFEGDDALPDWLLKAEGVSETEEAVELEDVPDWLNADTVEGDEALPDWLLETGGGSETEEAVELEDVPDWMKADTIEGDDDDLPDWLAATEIESGTEEDDDLEDVPDWMEVDSVLDDEEPVSETFIEAADMEDEGGTAEETADWLGDFELAEQNSVALPDWLEESPDLIVGQTDIDHERLPDWLDGDSQEDMVREDLLMGNSEEQENKEPDIPEDLDEAMKWLEELAAEQGADLAELPSLQQDKPTGEASAVEGDEAPDWLKADLSDGELSSEDDLPNWLKQEAESMTDDDWLSLSGEDDLSDLDKMTFDYEDAGSEEPVQSDDIPDWLKAQMPDDLQPQISEPDSDDDLGWLDQIAAGEGAPIEELPTLSWDDDQEDLGLDIEGGDLSWMDGLAEDGIVSQEEEADLSDIFSDSAEEVSTSVPDDPDEAMAWLEQLAAQQGAPLDELPTVIDDAQSVSEEVSLADVLDLSDIDEDAPTVFELPEEAEVEAMADFGVPDDPDEAMAWLEQLAAQQGASLDELPTVVDTDVELDTAVVSEMDSSEIPTVIDLPEDQVSEAETETAGFDIPDDPDEAMAWLEQLAARQGASLDELPTVDVVPEMITPVTGIAMEAEELEMALESEAVSEPEVDPELEMALAELSDIDMPEDDDEALAWLTAFAVGETAEEEEEPEPVYEALEDISDQTFIEPEAFQAFESFEAVEGIEVEAVEDQPLEFGDVPEEDSLFDTIEDETDQFIDQEVDLSADAGKDFEDEDLDPALPDWLQIGPLGDTSQEELDWLDSFGDSNVDSWLEAEEEITQFDLPAMTKMPEPEPIVIPEPQAYFETGPLEAQEVYEDIEVEAVPSGPVDEVQLESARSALEIGDFDSALDQYNSLLQSGQGIPLVIADLETASTRHTNIAPLQRLLGDAYMQNGQLQKAIDTYRQALDNL